MPSDGVARGRFRGLIWVSGDSRRGREIEKKEEKEEEAEAELGVNGSIRNVRRSTGFVEVTGCEECSNGQTVQRQ